MPTHLPLFELSNPSFQLPPWKIIFLVKKPHPVQLPCSSVVDLFSEQVGSITVLPRRLIQISRCATQETSVGRQETPSLDNLWTAGLPSDQRLGPVPGSAGSSNTRAVRSLSEFRQIRQCHARLQPPSPANKVCSKYCLKDIERTMEGTFKV